MITRTSDGVQAIAAHTPNADWQTQLREVIRDPATLLDALSLPHDLLAGARGGHAQFSVRVPRAYLNRMTPGDRDDPLLRQVLPLTQETDSVTGFVTDPLAEADHTPRAGLIHKYAGRVLLIASAGCAINCRYCFRRHFPYEDHTPSMTEWQETLDYLRNDTSITEAILSGGDPLVSSDRRLAWLCEALAEIPHLRRLRIHTRLPVVIPDRINEALLEWLGNTRLQRVMVLHINHPREIDEHVSAACQRLRQVGVTLLNQSVLLRHVNDSVDTLAELSERLFEVGIQPYYLHVLDAVAGAAHFDVPDDEARSLVARLRTRVSGFLVPRLVREIPEEASKTPL
ncbi:EF-P beta-lysylation protein EpmB [Kushneria phosphatilytica]|uniref:L-lysine 2,3-aminomutase n=1 Tax=Kushneria phosphatilytica TaxID=657387 RepID=A0A1S1NPM4_9GAMM|nr:EF-P beta-lysylation protein EpmB [Kushneria phosphatilytica]OHV09978.1 EF-P beta-lysylation protein EpmB [Kushneria phosphatilytica]QEL11658.1 EF-P beta-lysylation protein EpmB [Kushneria phosphatilytica]